VTEATATAHYVTDNQTVWDVCIPAKGKTPQKSYWATTYPDSDLLFLRTASGRVIPTGAARKLIPIIKDAIAKATR
jgi:hypothetical protein